MRDLKIAYGNSRQAKFWSNKTMTFDELCDRLKHPIRTSETAEEYPKLPKNQRDDIKDKGDFVAGHLRDNRRQANKVACRSMLVYDLDSITSEFLNHIAEKVGNKGCFYTTHSHTLERQRARMIIPVTRDMTLDEYNAEARSYAADKVFLEMLAPCSFSPHQLMYWPTCPSNGAYLFGEIDGECLDPDTVLVDHANWQDCSLLPTTPKESKARDSKSQQQKDPLKIHKFGDLGDKKSFIAAVDFADEDWKKQLKYTAKGAVLENCLYNVKLIMQNDPNLQHIVFNQLADGLEIKDDVPWQHPAKFWRDADDAQLICYVDDHYGSFSQRNYDIVVTKVADDRSYHPIRQYFEGLPPWDGVKRVDTLFIDYLGADDNDYIRAVCRKTLCAAYKRVYNPGIKFDYLPVFNGAQGIGKSTFISKLGMEWFSDSLTLSDMNYKTAAEKLQGYWIHEIGELVGMKKADLDKVKAFASRCDDKYRVSFGKRVTPHPRQCVFFGTTNSENGYLRDITGNRRFWNVKVSGNSKYKPWELTDEVVQQIWAETVIIAKEGETLFLPPELERYAQDEQRDAMEQDDHEGFVREYLDMLLPLLWDSMDMYKRRAYFSDSDDPIRSEGVIRRDEVFNLEIWCECFGKAKEDIKSADSYAIAAIMKRLKDLEKTDTRKRIPIYGLQRIYVIKTL